MRQIVKNPDWTGSGGQERGRNSLCLCDLADCACVCLRVLGNRISGEVMYSFLGTVQFGAPGNTRGSGMMGQEFREFGK